MIWWNVTTKCFVFPLPPTKNKRSQDVDHEKLTFWTQKRMYLVQRIVLFNEVILGSTCEFSKMNKTQKLHIYMIYLHYLGETWPHPRGKCIGSIGKNSLQHLGDVSSKCRIKVQVQHLQVLLKECLARSCWAVFETRSRGIPWSHPGIFGRDPYSGLL